ncbi:MAG: DNA topoisomerase 4 subunit A [Lachnospiraceae bacterium]|jgi:DNA gyrase subunit A|nr:DNA topoisomerase 4 subunit A [Lachnospiraceae bacterium]
MEQIISTEYADVMQKSYVDYAMSVITARALPDVRDGLKPVQRRVLYAMHELGLNYDKPHRKSARIVGDTMGKYHPHGDSSIYEALVVMEQDFKKGMALVDGHGNFGSIEGDGAAAMRYTEARLKKFTQEVYLKDLDKDIIPYISNFDETEKEPEVLPVRVPNLLINGADGIAVGMATSIPPHNLGEVIEAMEAYLYHPEITVEELMEYVKGPDFPTGGMVINKKDLLQIYETGVGKIKVRGKVEIERGKKKTDKDRIIITEIPYTLIGSNLSKFLSDVANLVETRKTTDIVDISNESSKDGLRIVIELKKNADAEKLVNLLYKKTKLEDTFGVNMLAIANGKPERLSLKDIIRYHIDFQMELTARKYRYLLEKELEKKEVREGLIRAYDILDFIIEMIRGSKSIKEVKKCLMTGDTTGIHFKTKHAEQEAQKLDFTEKQASAILELRLQKLVGLEIDALQKEYAQILKNIHTYQDILENYSSMIKVIKKDLEAIKKEFSLERKTVIEDGEEAVYEEEMPKEQEVVFVMDRFGYAKTVDTSIYERNKETIEAENKYVFRCMNTEKICIFTDTGLLHQVKVFDIPNGKLRDKGQPIDNMGNYSSNGERIVCITSSEKIKEKKLLFVTEKGMVKFVDGGEFEVSRRTVAATKLLDEDKVAFISVIEKDMEQIVLQTKENIFLRFYLEEIPEKKKTAVGVRGIQLKERDFIIEVYLMEVEQKEIFVKEKAVLIDRIKLTQKDTKGMRLRI